MGNWIDHLVFAAPSLDVGRAAVARLLGVEPVLGGAHPGAGTHNALVSLGAPSYLEVLARDPAQAGAPPSPLVPDDLGDDTRLVAFCVGCDDLDTAVAGLRAAGVESVGDPFGMSRQRPDGMLLSWRLSFIGGWPGGAVPFLISWDSGGSPAYDAPEAGRLVALRASGPDPAPARVVMDVLGIDVSIESTPTARLEPTIKTLSGTEVLLT